MHRFSRWKQPLMAAQSVAEVKRLMADYVAGVTPEDRAPLPAAAQKALNVDDVAESALVLTREEVNFVGDPAVTETLHEIAQTFIAASQRIVSIQARGEADGKASP